MWPFNSNQRHVKFLCSSYEQLFATIEWKFNLNPDRALADDYVLGFIFGEAVAVLSHRLRGSGRGKDYDAILFQVFGAFTGEEGSKNLLKRIGSFLSSESQHPFRVGVDRGRKTACVLFGVSNIDSDPDVIRARKDAFVIKESRKFLGQPTGTDNECAALALRDLYLVNYLETKYPSRC